ncbi:MAG: DUF1553 domain-containing protein [Verrucomicrobia bacterium]|nr:MAG: DUF1553 domain-containing protein [Verrucomicrobiota bacterium]
MNPVRSGTIFPGQPMRVRFSHPRFPRWATLAALLPWMLTAAPVDFSREIQPILSENCYHCHGPSETGRKAELRLDTREGAFRTRKGKVSLVAGKSAESEVYRRLVSKDPDEVMPPPESHRSLTPKQIALLGRWIDEGAKWGRHWAFVPPEHPAVPVPKRGGSRNPIDAFVEARLEESGLHLSPEADRARLLRRVSLDLTGLPPTPAEAEAFERDTGPDAYGRAVDRLLASPRFGERMATDWLDVARFADTHGFQTDRYRPVWPYRDWVIGAFNRNLPFDQFVLWQLAGDLLPGATKEQRLATTFNRLHLQNEEGGIVEEEYRVVYVTDRVNTFATTFLGLTFECARCHDHKYDPISQKDFYRMFSFLQNIDESGQSVYFGDIMPVPTMLLSTDEQDRELASLRERIRGMEAGQASVAEGARGAFAAWLARRPTEAAIPGLVGAYAFDELKDGKTPNGAAADKPGSVFEGPRPVAGHRGQALEFSGENGARLPGIGHFTRADPFTISLWIQPASHAPRQVVIHHSQAWMDAGSRGYELVMEDGHAAVGLHHMWPGNAIKVRTRAAIPTNAWTHVAFTYDGSSRARGVRVYLDGVPAEVEVIRDHLWKDITYGSPDVTVGQRFRDNGFKGGRVDDVAIHARALTPLEVGELAGRGDLTRALRTPEPALAAADREGLAAYFRDVVHEAGRKHLEALAAVRREENQKVTGIQDIMVMQEMDAPKPAHVLKRGMYDAPGEAVTADTPAAIGTLPAGEPRNRLGLARWLIDPRHPLMTRVTVNRIWQGFFGRGLVETADNFGIQGSQPTHPDLLDWLAVAFGTGTRDVPGRPIAAWDYKALCRLIVTSETYRQTSATTPELLAVDPDNRLLGRAPARRLTAEMLRDQALLASGLLKERLGGPSVKPYQPDGLWEVSGGHYDKGRGDDLYRRSLYTYWKRTTPPPAMTVFDAAERSICVARRQSTSTPLQSLALLNDVQITEAARFVAQRMLRDGGADTADRVGYAFRLVTGRRAKPGEIAILRDLFREQREGFAADPESAKRLLAVGETRNAGGLDPADLAAGTVLAQALLNHDESMMRR